MHSGLQLELENTHLEFLAPIPEIVLRTRQNENIDLIAYHNASTLTAWFITGKSLIRSERPSMHAAINAK
jgi:hypothetical protein